MTLSAKFRVTDGDWPPVVLTLHYSLYDCARAAMAYGRPMIIERFDGNDWQPMFCVNGEPVDELPTFQEFYWQPP